METKDARRLMKDSRKGGVRKPLSIALFVLWLCTVAAAVAADAITDVFQSQGTEFPLGLISVCSTVFNIMACVWTTLLGCLNVKDFHAFQPFQGGLAFVVCQCTAFTLIALVPLVKMLFFEELRSGEKGSSFFRYGFLSSLGGLSAAAQAVLMYSLSLFNHRSAATVAAGADATAAVPLPKILQCREVYVILPCAAAAVVTSAVAEWYPGTRQVNALVLAVLICGNTALFARRVAPALVPGLPMWTPSLVSPLCTVLQLTGLSALGTASCGVVVLCLAGRDAATSWHLACGLLSAMSAISLLLYSHLAYSIRRTEEVGEDRNVASEQTRPAEGWIHGLSSTMYGPLSATIMCLCLMIAVFLLTVLHYLPQVADDPTVAKGAQMLQMLLSMLPFVLPPATYLQGRLAFGRGFHLWAPFSGSPEFVLLQTVCWGCFGIAIFLAILNVSERTHTNLALLQVSTLACSQLFMHASLHAFRRNDMQSATRQRGGDAAANGSPQTPSFLVSVGAAAPQTSPGASNVDPAAHPGASSSAPPPPVATAEVGLSSIINGEFLLGVVLELVSITFAVVCDTVVLFRSWRGASALDGFPLDLALQCGWVFTLLAPVAAQISLRDRISLSGFLTHTHSSGYVTLQMMAWISFVLSFVWHVLSQGVPALNVPATVINDLGNGAHTFRSLFEAIPLVCIVFANIFETQHVARRHASENLVNTAVIELEGLLRDLPARELQRAKKLIRTIARREEEEEVASESTPDQAEGVAAAHAAVFSITGVLDGRDSFIAARDMTALLVVACLLCFVGAASLPTHYPPFLQLALAVSGTAVLSLSCSTVHCIFGTQFHRSTGDYQIFMPFGGGRKFVLLQALGWGAYTMCCLLLLTIVIEGSCTSSPLLMMAAASTVAQIALLYSIPLYTPQTKKEWSFIKRNAEGVLSLLVVTGVLLYARVYSRIHDRGDAHSSASSSASSATTDTSVLVSIVLSSLSAVFAVPMSLLSLQKQAQQNDVTPAVVLGEAVGAAGTAESQNSSSRNVTGTNNPHDWDDDDDDLDGFDTGVARLSSSLLLPGAIGRTSSGSLADADSDVSTFWRAASTYDAGDNSSKTSSFGSKRRRQTSPYVRQALIVLYSLSVLLVMLLLVLLLLAFVMGVGFYTRGVLWASASVTGTFQALIVAFSVLTVLPTILTPIIRRSTVVRNVHGALCCFALYSIPTFTVLGGLFPGFVIRTRGAYHFTFLIVLMACVSTLPKVHLMCYIFNVVCFALFGYYHLQTCLREGKEPFRPLIFASDMLCTVFWMWYGRRFYGRPERTGRMQSTRATAFIQKHFFEGLAHYFSLKIIVSDYAVLPLERDVIAGIPEEQIEMRVDLNDPTKQYMFSFHPHGVFPGTSICVPKTRLWEKVVGRNDKHFVSTHCADVIFSVPIMREFPLALGAMSVSRTGIENSLRSGNSPLIITGGQSEMLLTRISDTEMHLVCHHLGFIRLAMKHRVPLVPVISFSESNIMDNIHMMPLQRWSLKHIAFPFPVLPYGRWKLPLPTSRPITVVVGQPLRPLPGHEDPDVPAHVEEMRLRYFEHLEVLFYRYRAAAGYPDMVLVFHNGVDSPGVVSTPPPAQHLGSDEGGAAVPRSGPGSPLSAARRALSGFVDAVPDGGAAPSDAGAATAAAATPQERQRSKKQQ